MIPLSHIPLSRQIARAMMTFTSFSSFVQSANRINMKLSNLSLLLIFLGTLVSCKKEYSIENGGAPSTTVSEWQFNEGGKLYKGTVDTAYIGTIAGFNTLSIEGTSDTGQSEIDLT